MTRILVVDDMAVFREPIAASLRSRGYQTICASNGLEALSLTMEAKPDIILLDVAMPRMDGLTMLQRLREDAAAPKCAVILLTAVAERDYVLRARELGVRDYLLKSHFSLDELDARIQKCLNECEPQTPVAGANKAAAGHTPEQGGMAQGSTTPPRSTSGPDSRTPEPSPADREHPDLPADESTSQSGDPIKSLRPIVTRSEIDDLLKGFGELKGLSSTIMEVQKLSRNPRSTAEQIANVIRRDQAIALKVLKLANSSAYMRGDPVDSLEKAVVRIGISAIGQAVMNLGVIDQFAAERDHDKLDPQLFWEHSISTGLIAARLADTIEDMSPDTAFAIGLLHDVGKMVYSDFLGERYMQTMHTAHELQVPLERVERRMLLVTHADAMDRVLRSWAFAPDMLDPIVLHHHDLPDMHKLASKRVEQVAMLALANILSHALLLGSSGNEVIYPTSELCDLLGTGAETIRNIETSIPQETDEIKFSLLATSTASLWPSRAETWKEDLGCPIRAAFASPDPETDSYRVFFDRIGDRSLDTPNLIVAHVPETRDRSPVSTAVLKAESEAGVSNLPLLVLTPHGNISLEDRVTSDRRILTLTTPTTVSRLVTTVQAIFAEDQAQNRQAA